MKTFLIIVGVLLAMVVLTALFLVLPCGAYFLMIWAGASKAMAIGVAILVFVISGITVKVKQAE